MAQDVELHQPEWRENHTGRQRRAGGLRADASQQDHAEVGGMDSCELDANLIVEVGGDARSEDHESDEGDASHEDHESDEGGDEATRAMK